MSPRRNPEMDLQPMRADLAAIYASTLRTIESQARAHLPRLLRHKPWPADLITKLITHIAAAMAETHVITLVHLTDHAEGRPARRHTRPEPRLDNPHHLVTFNPHEETPR